MSVVVELALVEPKVVCVNGKAPPASVPQENVPSVLAFTSQSAVLRPETMREVEDARPETVRAVVEANGMTLAPVAVEVKMPVAPKVPNCAPPTALS